MVISQLIETLAQAMEEYGDNEVILIKKALAYDVAYLGTAALAHQDNALFFFLSVDGEMYDELDKEAEEFKAPKSPVLLRLVK